MQEEAYSVDLVAYVIGGEDSVEVQSGILVQETLDQLQFFVQTIDPCLSNEFTIIPYSDKIGQNSGQYQAEFYLRQQTDFVISATDDFLIYVDADNLANNICGEFVYIFDVDGQSDLSGQQGTLLVPADTFNEPATFISTLTVYQGTYTDQTSVFQFNIEVIDICYGTSFSSPFGNLESSKQTGYTYTLRTGLLPIQLYEVQEMTGLCGEVQVLISENGQVLPTYEES